MKRKSIKLKDFLYGDVVKPEEKPGMDPETTASIRTALVETGF